MEERDEEAVRLFAERLAMTMYEMGFPRMPARVFCALNVAEEGAMTAGQLSEWLRVSPAAISGAVRYLVQVGFVVREPAPGSRSDRYRALANNWYLAGVTKSGVYKRVADLVAQGTEVVGKDTEVGARLTEMAEFFVFLQDEFAALVEKWQASRAPSRTAIFRDL